MYAFSNTNQQEKVRKIIVVNVNSLLGLCIISFNLRTIHWVNYYNLYLGSTDKEIKSWAIIHFLRLPRWYDSNTATLSPEHALENPNSSSLFTFPSWKEASSATYSHTRYCLNMALNRSSHGPKLPCFQLIFPAFCLSSGNPTQPWKNHSNIMKYI